MECDGKRKHEMYAARHNRHHSIPQWLTRVCRAVLPGNGGVKTVLFRRAINILYGNVLPFLYSVSWECFYIVIQFYFYRVDLPRLLIQSIASFLGLLRVAAFQAYELVDYLLKREFVRCFVKERSFWVTFSLIVRLNPEEDSVSSTLQGAAPSQNFVQSKVLTPREKAPPIDLYECMSSTNGTEDFSEGRVKCAEKPIPLYL